ncbi:sigma-70 family RNA polymerase sigma factor [Alkalihalobacterium elongatum]|uniref:sigma-70 family RNA polymerase sigma factor n=1 Tax=Alkalihalobacterium elongatum TaxID=2675466 RepID=UPI001C1F3952|nr:sigma-70 family RNA polymerase sigma factor [Alkalihalobacterium elongatum]
MKETIDSIYEMYFPHIYRFLLSLCHDHYTAEDLVQETFFRAHLYVENYEGESIKSWLFTVAHHAFIDYERKRNRTVIKEENFFSNFFHRGRSTEDQMIVSEEIQEIINLLEHLPEQQKLAVLLHDFNELSYQEAAGVMNVSLANFKVLLFRGRQAIRKKKGVNTHDG